MAAMIVGLTGGIGSGKSTVADLFAAQGVPLVDTDAIAHELTGPDGAAMPALRAAFGPEIARPDGGLNRAAMRARVFTDAAARQQLESILHPAIRAEADRRCATITAPYLLLVVPLLLESGNYRQRCQRILVVDCPEAVQAARVMARSGLSADETEAIMAAQASRDARLAIADDIIDNSSTPAHLAQQVSVLHQHYLTLAGRPRHVPEIDAKTEQS